MALSFTVFNKFKAIDGVTTPVKKMEKSVSKFGKTTTRAFKKADRQASKFSKTVKGILVGGAILASTALLQQGVRQVVSEFIQFDDAIFAAGARFKDIGPDVDNFTESIKGIQKAARDAGATTEFTATQSAQALDFLARAGFKSEEAIGSLNSMINLATASGEDFSRVADISSDLLGAFGLNADNTAQKIKNLNRLNDVLVKTVNSANVTVEDMFETMKQVGPVATGILGSSLEEVAAITAVLGSSGIKGSEAMTALKNAYLRLAAPTPEATRLMKALNLQIDDGEGGARKLTDVMEDLKNRMSGLGKIQQAQILDVLFGKRAIAGGKIIIDNIEKVREFEKAILSSGGTAQRTADIMRQSLGNRLKALNSAFIEFGFQITEAFKINGVDAISGLTKAIRDMDTKPIIDIANLFLDMGKSAFNLFTVNKDLMPTIITLTKLFIAYKIALIGFNMAMKLATTLSALNPFVAVALAIVGVGLAIKASIDNWDKLNQDFALGLSWMNDRVLAFADSVRNIFTGIGDFVGNIFSGIGQKFEAFASGIGGKLLSVLGFDQQQPQNQGTPVSPNTGMINTIRNETNNRSTVDVNLNNVPPGSQVKQTGNVQGFNLNMGFSGAG